MRENTNQSNSEYGYFHGVLMIPNIIFFIIIVIIHSSIWPSSKKQVLFQVKKTELLWNFQQNDIKVPIKSFVR